MQAHAIRRQKLVEALGSENRPFVLFAGESAPKNYRDNVHAFRASSHFLYLVGQALEGAALVYDGSEFTLYAAEPTVADALWHGAQPSLEEREKELNLPVRPLRTLENKLAERHFMTLPVMHSGAAQSTREVHERSLPLAKAMVAIRSTHDATALKHLRLAAEATHAAHVAGMRATRSASHEFEVCAAMEYALKKRAMGTAYHPIVTTRGDVLHNHEHHRALRPGDLLLADVGAEEPGGFAGDVTRTWPARGGFSASQAALYDVVLHAQQRAIAKCAPGVRYRDIHLEAARALTEGLVALGIFEGDVDNLVADGAHAIFFPHGIGHLLGLDVHDMEDLGDLAGYDEGLERSAQFGLSYLRLDRILKPGMVVTIEPGFYQVAAILSSADRCAVAGDRLRRDVLAQFSDVRGIRIEDDILITETGFENLSAAIPKTREEVEATLAS